MSGFNHPTLPSDTLFTAGTVVATILAGATFIASATIARAMAEASQVPALAAEIGRVSGAPVCSLFGTTLFVGVFCAGSAVLS